MIVRDAFIAEFDHEMAVTRAVLERVPDEALAWRPHEKSFSLGGLATHLAELPHWGRQILESDSYDVAVAPERRVEHASRTDVLATFDRHVAAVRRALVSSVDGALAAPWALRRGKSILLSMPRLEALRRFLLHHAIHHRGQMTVYLRLQGIPIPPIYGQTADERP